MKDFSWQATGAGALAAFVGCSSTVTVIVRGLLAVGASEAQAASGLMAVLVLMGLCGLWLTLRLRQPVSVVWSTRRRRCWRRPPFRSAASRRRSARSW